MKYIRKILCTIGVHSWYEPYIQQWYLNAKWYSCRVRVCKRCDALHYPDGLGTPDQPWK